MKNDNDNKIDDNFSQFNELIVKKFYINNLFSLTRLKLFI